ncbi:hypothetical protein SELMODRAFT_409865 [Selaginella moellendorffii]|uniref:Uncharacterized protein n=1 Tax=Selaginella moellendorffii TaxID=88036 RepID=D8RCQ5_SELML|nr:hypothetical protein SELMODRAFT_409865 [Selaginella moellendorffii]
MHDNELGAIANLHGSVIDRLELLSVAKEALSQFRSAYGFPGAMLAIRHSSEMPTFLPKVYKCSSSTSTVKSIMLLVKNRGIWAASRSRSLAIWQMVKILRRSMVSKTVLNDVFKADLPA